MQINNQHPTTSKLQLHAHISNHGGNLFPVSEKNKAHNCFSK